MMLATQEIASTLTIPKPTNPACVKLPYKRCLEGFQPNITSPPVQAGGLLGFYYEVTVEHFSPDCTIEVIGLPGWAVFDPVTMTVSGTPPSTGIWEAEIIVHCPSGDDR